MPPAPTPPCILVIDDDAMMRELLEVLLEREGYAVQSAATGDAALALLRHSPAPPAVFLADLQMPGISGVRLAGELRRLCPASTLLLAMSGSNHAGEAIASYDGFLMKPFSMEEFAAAITVPAAKVPASKTSRTARNVLRQPPPQPASGVVSIFASAAPAPELEPPPQAITAPHPASNSSMDGDAQQHGRSPQGPVVTSTASTHGPILNEEIYRQLAAAMPAQQLREMYAMCLSDVRRRIAAMRSLAAAGEATLFTREAHSIKGGCGMLGATELHTLATRLEKAGPAAAGSEGTKDSDMTEDNRDMTKDNRDRTKDNRDRTEDNRMGAKDVNSLDELDDACDRLERILGSRA